MIGYVVTGFLVGSLARLVKQGEHDLGILTTLGLGVVGALVGGVFARASGNGSTGDLDAIGLVLAILTATLLISIVGLLAARIRTSA